MATSEKHKAEVSPLTRAAIEWLDLQHPEADHCEPGWVLSGMIEGEYPGGFDRFVEDVGQATAVS